MRNSIFGGFLGVLAGAAFLAACGGSSSSAPAALTQAELDVQTAALQSQIDQLKADLMTHETDTAAHPGRTPRLGMHWCIAVAGQFPTRNLVIGDPGTEISSAPYLGSVALFAGNFPPQGWLFCEGQELPINQNQSLYSLLGTTYGGDGRVNFRIPDLRNRVPVHVDTDVRWGEQLD